VTADRDALLLLADVVGAAEGRTVSGPHGWAEEKQPGTVGPLTAGTGQAVAEPEASDSGAGSFLQWLCALVSSPKAHGHEPLAHPHE
jgi:hypothetical protein